ncbi:MAG: hypothetical protein H7335_04440 [Massilia sp.]|nr:hypothetical protein [Massilia sp.]
MKRTVMQGRVVRTVLLTSLAGCSGISAELPIRSSNYPLAEHQGVKLSPTASVRYERFDDSRCPKDTACIWAGKLNYHFTLSGKAGSERFMLAGEGERHASTMLPGVRFGVSFAGVRERPTAEHAVVLEVDVLQVARR